MIKSHRVLPGYNTIVAGCGPLLAVVASGIIKAGGHVKAVIDLNSSFNWFSSISSMLIKEVAKFKGNIKKFATKSVIKQIKEKV